jgi:tetratricopeptide (TPR) repeat protein
MRISALLIGLSALVAGSAGYMLYPSSEEQLAMLARDGRSSEALSQLTQLLASSRRDPTFLAAAARVHQAAGRLKPAAKLLELYLVERPQDTQALDWLASIYRAAEDPDGTIRALAQAVAIEPTRARVSDLLDLYRARERPDEERTLLKSITDETWLRPVDVERFGILLSWAGEREAALVTLRRADALLPKDAELGRIVLFDLLLKLDLREEAAERAARWVADWTDKPWLGVHVTRVLAKAGDAGRAVAIGNAVIERYPSSRFYLARVVAEDGSRNVAGALLESWARDDVEPSVDDVSGYVAAAHAVADASALWRKVSLILCHPTWLGAHIAVAEALVQQYGFDVIATIRPRLSWGALQRRPLFSARLALHESNAALARRLLEGVAPATLAPAAQAEWTSLLSAAWGDEGALAILSDLARRRLLPVGLVPMQVRLAARLGDGAEHLRAMGELRRVAVASPAMARIR